MTKAKKFSLDLLDLIFSEFELTWCANGRRSAVCASLAGGIGASLERRSAASASCFEAARWIRMARTVSEITLNEKVTCAASRVVVLNIEPRVGLC